ncbi:MAG: hypothetical protein V1646_00770 [bacterium]
MIELIKKEKNFLLLTFSLSLVIKAIFFLIFLKNNPCLLLFDSEHYHKIALSLVSGNGFYNLDGVTPQFYRMPGYPVFLAGCYKLFGIQQIAVIILQTCLSSFIPLLIFLLTLTLLPSQLRTAKLASLAACIDLGYIIFSGLIMSEILFTIFFTFFLILFLYNYTPFFCKKESLISDNHPIFRLFLAGIILGIAGLIRPVGYPVLLTSIFLLLISKDKILKKIKSITVISTGFICVLSIWIMRNFILTGYIFMHTLSGPHFLNHTAVRLCMIDEKITYEQAQKKVYAELKNFEIAENNSLGRPLQEIEFCQLAEKLAISYMLKNPVLTAQHFISNMLKTTFGLYSSELLMIDSKGQLPEYSNNRSVKSIFKRFLLPDVNNKFIILVIYFEIIFFLFLLFGLVMFIIKAIFDREKICVLIKALPFICCLIFLTLSCGYARLRLPIESFLIILAIKEWQFLFSKKGE